jgi:triacylglycerol esterase/lipase EstA (alpha/beta hydrolase family)
MIAVLLTLLVASTLIVTLLTYTLFCYEEANRTKAPLSRYLSLAARTALGSFASETLILLLHPMGLWPGLWRNPTRGQGLVVMVHGLFHNPSAWILARHRLQAQGLATACFSYPCWNTDWDTTVLNLKNYLDELVRSHPGQNIHLLGHSMGGLLLCAALPQVEDARSVRSLITLGTPYGGSKLAPFALGSLGRFLRPEQDTMARATAQPIPAHVRCLALRSPADNMVLPNTALLCPLPGWTERETGPVSHVAMLHSKKVFQEVADWIAGK